MVSVAMVWTLGDLSLVASGRTMQTDARALLVVGASVLGGTFLLIHVSVDLVWARLRGFGVKQAATKPDTEKKGHVRFRLPSDETGAVGAAMPTDALLRL